jgi:hypothetical protein
MRQLRNRPAMEESVNEMVALANQVARPKAVYALAYVDEHGDDSVVINGVRFTSQVLRVNLDKVHRVFPYVTTCGREIDAAPIPADDMLKSFCMDTIKRTLVASARLYMDSYLKNTYAISQTSRMSPGSLEDWPITQQKELFSLLGNVEEMIGVQLTPSFLMVPVKSVSGICFPTEVRFESCMLCPREVCEGRRAPFDAARLRAYKEQAVT